MDSFSVLSLDGLKELQAEILPLILKQGFVNFWLQQKEYFIGMFNQNCKFYLQRLCYKNVIYIVFIHRTYWQNIYYLRKKRFMIFKI